MKAWTSLIDTSAVKTYREVPALRNNAFREFVVVVCAHRARPPIMTNSVRETGALMPLPNWP
jgi:hypothetical protein